MKRKLTAANQEWNYWKFQIHWNKLEQVNPRSRDEINNPFLCLQNKCFKDNDKPAPLVGHSK